MAVDVDNVISGPARFLLTDTEVGHTAGGISVNITPQNRAVHVDQFGKSEVNIRHIGDEVRCRSSFAEWAEATIAQLLESGNDDLSANDYMGIGRASGYIHTAQDIKVKPKLTAHATKYWQFWRGTPIGELAAEYDDGESDIAFDLEFACLVDEAQADGENIGKMFITP